MPPTTSAEPRAVAERSLDGLSPRILIAVPMADKDGSLACIQGVGQPTPARTDILKVASTNSAVGRNAAVQYVLNHGYDYLIMVDDDTFPPPHGLIRLMQLVRGGQRVIAAAHYAKRIPGLTEPEPTSWTVRNGEAVPVALDGTVQDCIALGTGCIAIPVQAFREVPEPWFSWDGGISDDVHFSQLAREAGWTLKCATDVVCAHVDRETGESF